MLGRAGGVERSTSILDALMQCSRIIFEDTWSCHKEDVDTYWKKVKLHDELEGPSVVRSNQRSNAWYPVRHPVSALFLSLGLGRLYLLYVVPSLPYTA